MTLLVLAALTFVVLGTLGLERYVHARYRARIPTVIHVNGTRGKSSVTRLIAAGLREGGITTWAKVTGTLPRLIDAYGEDIPIVRHGPATISEQRALLAGAARAGVEALVIECMALKPEYQRVSEDGLVQATIGVITNVRPDHVEVFGTDPRAMLSAFAATMPRGKIVFTAEGRLGWALRTLATRRRAELVQVERDAVDDYTMARFAYHEHKDNVALALAVCMHLGVDREAALRGMASCRPDVGALTTRALHRGHKELILINAMAANDPQSTYQLYRDLVRDHNYTGQRLVVANARRDRPNRTQQLAVLIPVLAADHVVAVGDGAVGLAEMAGTRGLSEDRISVHQGTAADLVSALFARTDATAVVFAMGNIAGPGLALADYFEAHGGPVPPVTLHRPTELVA
jgi:poly-gamma-glutamate synthase PgsB/CapB